MGDLTYITWTLSAPLANNETWNAQVVAQLPPTFSVGTEFTATADVKSETYPGDHVDEGIYVKTQLHKLLNPQSGDPNNIAGLDNTKMVWSPEKDGTTWVAKIGDTVSYTVVTRLGSNTVIETSLLYRHAARGLPLRCRVLLLLKASL